MAINPDELKEEVFGIMKEMPLEELTAKKVRRLIETKRGMEKGAADEHKDDILKFIDEFIRIKNEEEDEAGEEEEEAKPRPKKKARSAGSSTGSLEAGPNGEPPKGLKDLQCALMSGREFEKSAERLKVEVFGNHLEGDARTFTSGNRGWYAGKKICVEVGGKKMWAQVGLNITIIGSKEWRDKTATAQLG